MTTRWVAATLALTVFAGCFGTVGDIVRGEARGHLPISGDVHGLELLGDTRLFASKESKRFHLGNRARPFTQYGVETIYNGEYYYGGKGKSLTIDVYKMATPKAAMGLFHWHRGYVLLDKGTPVDVGAEGVVDTLKKRRNLYFYKQYYLVSLVYSGPEPVPDLLPVARFIARQIPGENVKPRGFELLDVEGINAASGKITPGNTFNAEFLPPSIRAYAPAAGPLAEIHIMAFHEEDRAKKVWKDYREYLQLEGEEFGAKLRLNRPIWWARDPQQGRVVCMLARDYVLILSNVEKYELGAALLDRVGDRIYARQGTEERQRRIERELREHEEKERRRREEEARQRM